MCVACVLPKDSKLSEKEFQNCWESNPDGGGYAYLAEGGNIIIKKCLNYETFRKMWVEDFEKRNKHSPFLLHFRIKSVGEISLDNCHPFRVNPKVAMIHNGTFHKVKAQGTKSDTAEFAEWLGSLPHNFLNNDVLHILITDFIGQSNKVAFMDNTGKFTLFNEKAGITNDGRWFSNSSFQSWSKSTNHGTKYSHSSGYQPPMIGSGKNTTTSWNLCKWCDQFVEYRNYNAQKGRGLCDECVMMVKRAIPRIGMSEYAVINILDKIYIEHASQRKKDSSDDESPIKLLTKPPTDDELEEAFASYLGGYG